MNRPVDHIELNLFEQAIQEVGELQNSTALHHFGDPILHPDLPELVQIAREVGVESFLSTTGNPLTDHRTEKLLDAKPHFVGVSFGGISEETYNKMQRGGNFEVAKKRINRLIRRRDERGQKYPIIQINLIKTALNEHEVDDIKRYWSQRIENDVPEPWSDPVAVYPFHDWGGSLKEDTVSRMAGEDRRLFKNGNRFDSAEVNPCRHLWHNLVILHDGTVVPCCYDFNGDLSLGNIGEQSLEEIFNGEPYQKLRRQHLNDDVPMICKGCNQRYYERFEDPEQEPM
jgi:radical SAM protein with 4Fe4S-binding SPASM domain